MRTLIVDDSSFIREYLRQLLRRLDTEYAEAGNGADALNVLRSDQRFDLMLVDVNMPVMNGLECVQRLRNEGLAPGMKVMMVTTEADHALIEQALDFGADEFLMKPFTVRSLQEKLMLVDLTLAV